MKRFLSLFKSTRSRLVTTLFLAVLVEVALTLGVAEVTVSYYVNGDTTPVPSAREYAFSDPDATLVDRQISGTILLNSVLPAFLTDILVGVDDCLPEFIIPALSFSVVGPPYCDYQRPLHLQGLAMRMKPGVPYRYFARVTNFGGPGRFAIQVKQSPLVYTLRLLSWTGILISILWLFFGLENPDRGLLTALSIGLMVRLSYYFSFEPHVHSMDLGGHIHYISHMLDFWSVPHPLAGWEFHQPPLYYLVTAILIKVFCSVSGTQVDIGLMGRAVGFMFCTLTLSYILRSMALIVPPSARAMHWRNLLMIIVATFPNLIFCTMRISNDVMLFALLSYVIFLVLKQTVTQAETPVLIKALTSAVAILIKANGVLVVVFWMLSDFFLPSVGKRSARLRSMIVVAATFVLVAAGQTSFRYQQSANISPFHRSDVGLGPRLELTNDIGNFFAFNPWRVFFDTYVDPWGEGLHRSHFWEYLFKNFLFGEFHFGPYLLAMSRLMLLLWMVLTAVMLVQIFAAPASRELKVSLLLLGSALLLFVAFRVAYPYSSHQDARFLPPLFVLLPFLFGERMMAFCRSGLADRSDVGRVLQWVWESLLATLVVVQLFFMLWM